MLQALIPLLPPLVGVLAPILTKIVSIITDNPNLFAGFVVGIGALAAGLKLFGPLLAIIKGVKAAITGLKIAWLLLQIAFAVSPIGVVITGIIAAGVALWAFFTKTETGRKLWAKIWDGIKTAFTAVWEGVLKPAWEGMKIAWDGLVTGMKWAWDTILKPVWDGIVIGAQWLAGILLTALIAPVMISWNLMSAAFKFAWETVIKPVFQGIGAVATWLWQNVLLPGWEGIKVGFQSLGVLFQWVYDTILTPVFNGIGTVAMWLWNNVLTPFYVGVKVGFQSVGALFQWVYDTILKPVFNGIAAVATWLWNNVLTPAWEGIKAGFRAVGDFFRWVQDSILKPVLDALGSAVSWLVDNVAKPAFDRLKSALSAVGDFFRTTVDGIKTVWDKLKGYLATPINFMINSVWNEGVAKAWNTAREFLPGLPEAKMLSPIAFREGGTFDGRVSGPGTRTSDSILARLSRDEHVWDGMDVIKAGGHNVLYAMRAMIEKGIPFTWDQASLLADRGRSQINKIRATSSFSTGRKADFGLPGFATGGAVGENKVRPAWMGQLENGHRAAKMRNGNPYTWGFEDCSGYMSAIADAIINGGDGKWTWATASFPGGQPFVPGLGQGFSVGVHDNPGGPGGGHTAGTLSAVGKYSTTNVESGGAHNYVAYGGPAVGADHPQFAGKHPGLFHLAIGADGAFESGGGGGGPSPDEQRRGIIKKIGEVFSVMLDDVIDNMAGLIGAPPPEWLGIPPEFAKGAKDAAISRLETIVTELGDTLRTVYDAARSLGEVVGQRVVRGAGGALDAVGGLFRDQGGFIPNGLSIVRNETGAPEAVLNWSQLEMLKQMLADAGVNAEDLTAVKQVLSTSGLSMGAEVDVATMMNLPPTDFGGIWAETMNAASISFMSELGDLVGLGKSGEKLFKPIDVVDETGRRIVKGGESDLGANVLSDSPTGASGNAQQLSGGAVPIYGDPSLAVSAEKVTLKTNLPDLSGGGSFKATGNSMDYVKVIKDIAESMGLGRAGAKIGVATGIVESNIKILANNSVPESLKYPHDGIGGDHDSVGIFQQRQAGWGTLAQRMSADGSAKLFFDKLQTFNWRGMDPGAAAQKVQVSAFPLKYGQKMGEADRLLATLYDTGGVWKHGTLGLNLSGADEMVLKDRQWRTAEGALNQVIRAGRDSDLNTGRGYSQSVHNPSQMAETVIFQGMDERKTFEEWDRYQRQNMAPVLSGRYRGGN